MDAIGKEIKALVCIALLLLLYSPATGGDGDAPPGYNVWPQQYPALGYGQAQPIPGIQPSQYPMWPQSYPQMGYGQAQPIPSYQPQTIVINAPLVGVRGMLSDVPNVLLKDGDASYLLNAQTGYDGILTMRRGLAPYGSDQTEKGWGYFGLHDSWNDGKYIFGFSAVPDSGFEESAPTVSNAINWAAVQIDTAIVQLHVSTANETLVDNFANIDTVFDTPWDSAASGVFIVNTPTFINPKGLMDFVKWKDLILFTDGFGQPILHTMRSAKQYRTFHEWLWQDGYKVAEKPRTYSVGNEAPGQPRARVTNIDDNDVYGWYRYRYAYSDPAWDSVGEMGPISHAVFSDSQLIIIDGFDARPMHHSEYGTVDSIHYIVVYRDNNFDENWTAFSYTAKWQLSQLRVGDGGSEEGSPGTLLEAGQQQYYPKPGQFVISDTSYQRWDNTGPPASLTFLDTTAHYWIAYSYYEPFLGLETPLGPYLHLDSGDYNKSTGTYDSLKYYLKGHSNQTRYSYVRCYRSEADDSTIMYCVYQLPANGMYDADAARLDHNYGVYLQMPSDEVLHSGDWAGDLAVGSAYWGYGVTNNIYRDYDIAVGPYGEVIIRPEFQYGCPWMLSDLEVVNGRVWGIGDPQFNTTLFYSEPDDPVSWPVFNQLPINEYDGAAIVAIEKASTGNEDYLVVFKENGVFAVSGEDPNYGFSYYTLSNTTGAIHKRLVCESSGFIAFVDKELRMQLFSGGEVKNISQVVESHVASVLNSYADAVDTCRLFAVDDRFILYNLETDSCISYNWRFNFWTREQYKANFNPNGSFSFDTTQNFDVNSESNWLVYEHETGEPLLYSWDTTFDVEAYTLQVAATHPETYTTAYYPEFIYRSKAYSFPFGYHRPVEVDVKWRSKNAEEFNGTDVIIDTTVFKVRSMTTNTDSVESRVVTEQQLGATSQTWADTCQWGYSIIGLPSMSFRESYFEISTIDSTMKFEIQTFNLIFGRGYRDVRR